MPRLSHHYLVGQARFLAFATMVTSLLLWSLSQISRNRNVLELITEGGVIGVAIGLVLGCWLLTVLPSVWSEQARYTIQAYAAAAALAMLAWILITNTLPRESLHDLLGTPVTRFKWESAARFHGWVLLWLSAWLSPLYFGRKCLQHLFFCVLALPCSYLIIIQFAATNNITELLRYDAGILSFCALYLALVIVSLVSWQLIRTNRVLLKSASLLLGYLVSFSLLALAAEPTVQKGPLTFHALEFVFTGRREGDMQTHELLLLYALPYLIMISLLVSLRYAAKRLTQQLQPHRGLVASLSVWRATKTSTAEPAPNNILRHVQRLATAASVAFLLGWTGLSLATLGGWADKTLPNRNVSAQSRPSVPDANLLEFRYQRPRLPHPSARDNERLLADGNYLSAQRARAAAGKLGAQILMAYLEPGSVDLAVLTERLLTRRFTGRGNASVKPLAKAYDWLHPYFTEDQKQQIRDKLLQGCLYLIDYIEKNKLSVYNVRIYNSPLQALMACAIASHGDSAESDYVMNYTAHFWRAKVLPVWRQVMGNNGGWHEGGEYVAIGIGQAIFQLPNMWRTATGEDYFEEPGIRGFLDFLVYRTRPDGSHMRWGDGRFFAKEVPDRLALSLEYGNKAGYSIGREPKLAPTAWPWGPLPDNRLYDKSVLSQLPWYRYFDGIGLVVIRNEGEPTSTYASFKAGDNFWSHSHLDQGAFTLFKHSALAIDSGYYSPNYGSDHHMNYSYQTVAHNTVTVTAAETTELHAYDKKSSRQIANDGGQRRVGSGWGRRAPISLAEWQQAHAHYHTGRMLHVTERHGLLVASADLTAAYTNQFSGPDDIENRARRLQLFLRTWIYDRDLDLLLVADWLDKFSDTYPDRWLLHAIRQPQVAENQFILPGEGEEYLLGEVLRPEQHHIQLVGGNGYEFLVDGQNYPLAKSPKRRHGAPEPGAWRLEISPRQSTIQSHYVVVMLPLSDDVRSRPRITRDGDQLMFESDAGRLTLQLPDQPGTLQISKMTDDRLKEWSVPLTSPRASE